jgi:hypothetical protein
MAEPLPPPHPTEADPPPFGGTWHRLYALVAGWLALQVLLYWLFTRAFA